MKARRRLCWLGAPAALFLNCCIRPENYHPDIPSLPQTNSTAYFQFSSTDPNYSGKGKDQYFKNSRAYEAYVEFDARGSMYRDDANRTVQLNAALALIKRIKYPAGQPPRKIALYVFVHGWKNNASETCGNVWGFRRFLSEFAYQHHDQPVIGVYIGWPGASLKGDAFLSFWNREPVADNVGNNADLTDALRAILQAVKGVDYSDRESTAVVIGHSFGGIVMERVATKLIREQLQKPGPGGESPADLFVLLNEAGAAAIARPFLMDLGDQGVTYNDSGGHPHPLLLSMTSTGDVATKFAYPGGEFISFNRPATQKYSSPDRFGQESTLPYNLLTAANTIGLQSHQIVQLSSGAPCDLKIPLTSSASYCMNAIRQNRLNQTPYWIMQLPQVFVPDHSDIFQYNLLKLLSAVLEESAVTNNGPRAQLAQPQSPTVGRPSMKKAQ
jgi:pimeloyl-ACP methyl ester carboxylesterase